MPPSVCSFYPISCKTPKNQRDSYKGKWRLDNVFLLWRSLSRLSWGDGCQELKNSGLGKLLDYF